METAEIGHEGHSLGAESIEHPEEPKGAKEKADSRAPTVGLTQVHRRWKGVSVGLSQTGTWRPEVGPLWATLLGLAWL